MPRAHATPAFSDLKVSVYGMKGQCLWEVLFSLVLNTVVTGVEKWVFDFKMCVYEVKGKEIWDKR